MATSNRLMFFALSPVNLSTKRAVHFRPFVNLANSSKVCLASSRDGSTMTTRANSLPGLPKRTRRGPRKAIVLPLPVGADARTWLPAIIAGKHCIWIGVGRAKPSSQRFDTSHVGTPRARMASKVAMGSGAPALACIRSFLRKAAISSRSCSADFWLPLCSPAFEAAATSCSPSLWRFSPFLLGRDGFDPPSCCPLSPRLLPPSSALLPSPTPKPKKSNAEAADAALPALPLAEGGSMPEDDTGADCSFVLKAISFDRLAFPNAHPWRNVSKKSMDPQHAPKPAPTAE
mmetsp:Transcript_39464/g.113434  ORF Transcript_39464/g.113434 Transcript_39464/m.113434 type:complete len:288 (+) Transcript_39464:1092-1955(+)